MYIVVSQWEYLPGMQDEFERRGTAMRERLRNTPGVKLMEGFEDEDGGLVAILAYDSREAYEQIVNDPTGPFAKAMAELKLDECARWVRSFRGEAH